jgi:hypothetical protein
VLAAGYAGPDEKIPQTGVLLAGVGPAAWIPLARRAANRNLTRAEWDLYLPNTPYRPTFPDLPVPTE